MIFIQKTSLWLRKILQHICVEILRLGIEMDDTKNLYDVVLCVSLFYNLYLHK